MLYVTDGHTRRRTDLPTRRRGILVLRIHLGQAVLDATGMRALLVADVLRRALEVHGVQVMATLAPDGPAHQDALSRPVLDGFGIDTPGAGTDTDPPADAHIGAAPPPAASTGVWIRVGRVRQTIDAVARDATDATDAPADRADPLAVRLALLAGPHAQPVDLTGSVLATATHALEGWRRQVARWACAPSRPVPADIVQAAEAAIARDLATPALLELLRHVAAADTFPDGAKFETFALLDRILALELTREIGYV
ncbi:hypothetical protein ABTY63_21175 [Streptomyces solisilvae]|uniref:hypothetical protein n=1 Tax=Streptomyces malaysiensis TaxID=92644 RepID=UPI003326A455